MYLYIIAIILFIIALYIYFKPFEGFQNVTDASDNLLQQIDLSGVNLEQTAKDINNALANTTVDNRLPTDQSRVCDTLQNQINHLQEMKDHYRNTGDWSNIRLTNSTISNLQNQLSSLGCTNNNSQTN